MSGGINRVVIAMDVGNGKGCKECVSNTTRERYGYTRIGRNGSWTGLHRLVYEWAIGPIPDGMVVRHSCDNPRCVNPDHLLTGTHAENTADMFNRGRNRAPGATGTRNGSAKLNEDSVREIRKSTKSVQELAKIYSVSKSAIRFVVKRENWKHVE